VTECSHNELALSTFLVAEPTK